MPLKDILQRKRYHKKYYTKHRDMLKKKHNEYARKWYQKNKELHRANCKQRQINIKIKALLRYSNGKIECRCCKETGIDFLCLDHVNNDGNKHRKEIGSNIYAWLNKNNYSKSKLQILCYNCNISKKINGMCSHKINMKLS